MRAKKCSLTLLHYWRDPGRRAQKCERNWVTATRASFWVWQSCQLRQVMNSIGASSALRATLALGRTFPSEQPRNLAWQIKGRRSVFHALKFRHVEKPMVFHTSVWAFSDLVWQTPAFLTVTTNWWQSWQTILAKLVWCRSCCPTQSSRSAKEVSFFKSCLSLPLSPPLVKTLWLRTPEREGDNSPLKAGRTWLGSWPISLWSARRIPGPSKARQGPPPGTGVHYPRWNEADI